MKQTIPRLARHDIPGAAQWRRPVGLIGLWALLLCMLACGVFAPSRAQPVEIPRTSQVWSTARISAVAGEVLLTPAEREWLTQHDRERVIRIGITVIPPQILSENGDYTGLSIDYIRLMERKLDVRFKLVPYPTWNDVIEAAKKRQIDMIFAAQRTPERLSYLCFTEPYIELPNMILVRKDRTSGSSLSDMKGWSVAVSRGSAVQEYLKENFRDLKLRPVRSELEGLMKVSLGEVDAMVVEISRASYYIEKAGILNLRVAGEAGLLYQLRFAVRNDWPVLCEILDKGLSTITEQQRQTIDRRWILIGKVSIFASRTFWISILASLSVITLAIAATVAWNRTLRRIVRRRTSQLRRELAERAKAETALRESEEKYRRIVDTASEGIWTLGPDTMTTFVNVRMAKMLGHSADEMLGRPVTDFMFDEDAPDHAARMERRRQGLTEHYERRFRHRDGSTVWTYISATAILDDEHRFMGSVAMITDITERRQAQQDIALLNLALNNVHEAAYLIGEDTNFLYVNEEACRALGYTRDELLRLRVPDVDPDMTGDRWPEHWRELKAKGSLTFEGSHKAKDGRVLPVEINANYFEAEGRSYNLALARDITERRRTEAELHRYKDHLEEIVQQRTAELLLARDAADAANKAKSVFLANMSHELRTPLNAILGFSAMLRLEPDLAKGQREKLDIINRSGEHLLQLIDDVLEIAKIEAGRLQLEVAPFDLAAMVHDVTDLVRLRAEQKGLELIVDQSSAFPRYINGDEARLRQILVNLTGNAVKFTQAGSITIRLGLKQNAQPHLVMEVEDTGPGISAEDKKRLFKPFVQLGETGEQKGTGLGLTISRQFAELMGGTISVTSEFGKGSVFRVELPVELAEEASISALLRPATAGEVVGVEPGTPRHRILIAEDQAENRQLLSQLMSRIGLDVKTAEDGRECVRLFQEWHPHLIWMDRRMPVMDGIEATRRIRALPDGRDVKIVAVTASAFAEQQQEMLDAGMDHFVRKPYRFDEIYGCLAKQLDLRYVYETRPEDAATAAAELTPAMLMALPAPLRKELKEALESLDSDRIDGAIEQVGEIDSELSRILSRLSAHFDYPAILKALAADGS